MKDDRQAKLKWWTELENHKKAALAVALIVALADAVIVYDLYLSGTWLSPSLLSGAKTAAFVLLFIGSLIAEMQELDRRVRWLLLAGVILLCAYQASVNIVVNYHAATIPQSAIAFFEPWLNPMQVKFWYSIADGFIRTAVVVIMWLVTGLVWRGVAMKQKEDTTQLATLEEKLARLENELATAQANAQAAQSFVAMDPREQVRWRVENCNGEKPSNEDLATEYGVHPSTIGRWLKN